MRLLHTGVRMNGKKIRRLMKKFGLVCPIRKANPYRRMQKAIRTNNTAGHFFQLCRAELLPADSHPGFWRSLDALR